MKLQIFEDGCHVLDGLKLHKEKFKQIMENTPYDRIVLRYVNFTIKLPSCVKNLSIRHKCAYYVPPFKNRAESHTIDFYRVQAYRNLTSLEFSITNMSKLFFESCVRNLTNLRSLAVHNGDITNEWNTCVNTIDDILFDINLAPLVNLVRLSLIGLRCSNLTLQSASKLPNLEDFTLIDLVEFHACIGFKKLKSLTTTHHYLNNSRYLIKYINPEQIDQLRISLYGYDMPFSKNATNSFHKFTNITRLSVMYNKSNALKILNAIPKLRLVELELLEWRSTCICMDWPTTLDSLTITRYVHSTYLECTHLPNVTRLRLESVSLAPLARVTLEEMSNLRYLTWFQDSDSFCAVKICYNQLEMITFNYVFLEMLPPYHRCVHYKYVEYTECESCFLKIQRLSEMCNLKKLTYSSENDRQFWTLQPLLNDTIDNTRDNLILPAINNFGHVPCFDFDTQLNRGPPFTRATVKQQPSQFLGFVKLFLLIWRRGDHRVFRRRLPSRRFNTFAMKLVLKFLKVLSQPREDFILDVYKIRGKYNRNKKKY